MTNLDSIKSNPSTLSIYLSRISLKKDGKEWKGRCCFHSEKTGSLTVHQHGGGFVWRCFGACNIGGDVVAFIQKFESVGFKEAVELAERELGQSFDKTKKAASVFSSLSEPASVISYPLSEYKKYEDNLANSPEAIKWLENRGIKYETAKAFHTGLREFGSQKDRWIVFPSIRDNRVVAIEYRRIEAKEFKKQPGMGTGDNTPLYNETNVNPLEPVYLVEGKVDCLTMEQAGFRSCSVQSASTPLTAANKELLLTADYIVLAGDNDTAGNDYMDSVWKQIGERCYKLVWPAGMKDGNQTFTDHCGGDIEKFRELVEQLTTESKSILVPGMSSLAQTLKEKPRTDTFSDPRRWVWPFPQMDAMATIMPGSVVYLSATNALANGTGVFTPYGITPVEKLIAGTEILGSYGNRVKVTGVFPKGKRQTYRLNFTDNTSSICDAEHLWTVFDRAKRRYTTVQTQNMMATQLKNGKSYRYHIPFAKPASFIKREQPIPPYILGALLGDGSFIKYIRIAANPEGVENEVITRIKNELPDDLCIIKYPGDDFHWYIRNRESRKPNSLRQALDSLNLLGRRSKEKFIPSSYLLSTIEDRIAILQGLMDTDGSAKEDGTITFDSTSPELIDGVRFLVQSLGGMARKHEGKEGQYVLNISLPITICPFSMTRKKIRYEGRKDSKKKHRNILSIVPDIEQEVTCISVDATDGLFLIDDFVLTHNTGMGKTSLMMNASVYNAMNRGAVIVNYSAELSNEEYAQIVVAHLMKKSRHQLTEKDYSETYRMISDTRYYIGRDNDLPSINDAMDLMESAIRRCSATACITDTVHFLCVNEKDTIKAQENYMNRCKSLAQKYGVIWFNLGQPRKAQQQFKGKPIHVTDAKGSEALISSSDVAYAIHRELAKVDDPSNPPKEPYESRVQVFLQKGRNQGTGSAYTELMFDGETCSFFPTTKQEPPEGLFQ